MNEKETVDMNHALEQDFVQDLADFFKVFGDATRIRILRLLLQKQCHVGEIAQALDMTHSAVSHQLRTLRQSDLVRYHKEGKSVVYALDDDHVRMVLQQGIQHITHKRGYF